MARQKRKRRRKLIGTFVVLLGLNGGGLGGFVQSPSRLLAFREAMADIRSVGDVAAMVAKYQVALDETQPVPIKSTKPPRRWAVRARRPARETKNFRTPSANNSKPRNPPLHRLRIKRPPRKRALIRSASIEFPDFCNSHKKTPSGEPDGVFVKRDTDQASSVFS
jgi:hypothetical protein